MMPTEKMGEMNIAMLWCCHVKGPDDVYAAASEDDAKAIAKWLNDLWAKRTIRRHDDAWFEAVAAPWPYDAASHAADLAEGNTRFQ